MTERIVASVLLPKKGLVHVFLEFIQLCFSPINLLFTLMLLCIAGYWTMFFVGVVGLDFFDDLELDIDGDVDLDLDLDADVDIDADVDVDAEIDAEADVDSDNSGRSGWFVSLLKFLDVGDVPLMVLLTALVGSLWAVSILSSYYFNPSMHWLNAALLLFPDFAVSLLITKVMTYPASFIFKQTNKGIEKTTRIVGRTCTVTTSTVTESKGQAEIEVENAAPITLNVRCRSVADYRPLKKGDEALVLEWVEEKGTYIVVPFDLEVN